MVTFAETPRTDVDTDIIDYSDWHPEEENPEKESFSKNKFDSTQAQLLGLEGVIDFNPEKLRYEEIEKLPNHFLFYGETEEGQERPQFAAALLIGKDAGVMLIFPNPHANKENGDHPFVYLEYSVDKSADTLTPELVSKALLAVGQDVKNGDGFPLGINSRSRTDYDPSTLQEHLEAAFARYFRKD